MAIQEYNPRNIKVMLDGVELKQERSIWFSPAGGNRRQRRVHLQKPAAAKPTQDGKAVKAQLEQDNRVQHKRYLQGLLPGQRNHGLGPLVKVPHWHSAQVNAGITHRVPNTEREQSRRVRQMKRDGDAAVRCRP